MNCGRKKEEDTQREKGRLFDNLIYLTLINNVREGLGRYIQ